jgi:drug/metabolite transporter (DMT)-like permease
MNPANFARLLALAAIWGASFLFLRIGAPVLGPTVLIELRLGIAAVFLAVVAWLWSRPLGLRAHWRHYLLLGAFNAGLPFVLMAYAAQTLSASLLAILNATAPIFGAIIVALRQRERPRAAVLVGLGLGLAGVAIVVGIERLRDVESRLAVLAVLGGTLSYGIASTYARAAAVRDPFANAHGSMWGAALVVLPFALLFPAPQTPTLGVGLAVLALAVLCTGVAFLLYFRLIEEVGPTSALAVSFLIPVFGVLWGVLFLGERVTANTIIGAMVVLLGTALVTGVVGGRRPALAGKA